MRVYDNPVNRERRRRAEQLGERLGRTASQVALAWALHQPFPVYAALRRATPPIRCARRSARSRSTPRSSRALTE